MSDNDVASRYGNFEVLTRADGAPELLGGGSFGKTYKARHLFLEQIVALKVISEKFAHDKNAKERFLREARVVHGLRHPHIAQVIDFGEANGTLYYAMEYCEGGSLEELVRRTGPLDPATVLVLARQLTEALECAHHRGFIHRDVKPANVMLADASDAPVLKLVDFGLVKPLAQHHERMAALTLDGQNFFTPLFASPEQVMEEELDARSDLFSLGMTLWFLLRGNAPETGSTGVIMAKRMSAESYRPQLPADLPAKLDFVLRKLLEKDKANRFATATEARLAIVSGEPTPEWRPPSAPDHTDASDPGATLEFEVPPAPKLLANHYRIAEKVGRNALGDIYRANRLEEEVPLTVTVLDDVFREDAARMDPLRQAVARAAAGPEAVCRVHGLEWFDDAEVLVQEWSGGVCLQDVLKSRGSIPFAEALPLWWMLAAGIDGAKAAGLPGVRLTPDEIFLQPADGSLDFAEAGPLLTTSLQRWPPFRARLSPILHEDEAAPDVSVTRASQFVGSPRVEFAGLLYRLVAGRQVKFAARVNRDAYIGTSGLSEEGNRILSGCIADEAADDGSCAGLLTELQRAEGIGEQEFVVPDATRQLGTTNASLPGTGAATPPITPLPSSPVVPPPFPVPPPLSGVKPTAPGPTAFVQEHRSTFPSPKTFPLTLVLVGLAFTAIVLGAVAFLLRPKPSSADRTNPIPGPPTPVMSTPVPTDTPRVAPPVAPPATPPPAASPFVLRNAAQLVTASYELGGGAVTPEPRSGDLLFPMDGSGPSTELVVKVPGYKAVRLLAAAGNGAEMPSALERETAPVYLALRSRETDYAFVAFLFTAALPGENVKAPAEQVYSLKNISSLAKLELPTGSYDYSFYGPEQQQDTHIAPVKGTVTVRSGARTELPVAATFAGRFRGEFDDDKNHGHVVRTITIKPGLSEGRVDEQTSFSGKPGPGALDDLPLAEIRVDADGVLHGHIRYAANRVASARTYDELFELTHTAAGTLVMTGGRETMPDDPVLRSELEKKLKGRPPMQSNRPGETVLQPVD